ncbi:hypothetical protein HHL24_35395 [Paraburkholderia sp. RP-4-7]|jgi:uncharacterized protein (DUF2384 family)|uniref:Uncharacterized protein n=1 Tax=Paraburkholderia polaris TaxID=2728848 RepID=A0A848IVZ0_9BURK|nr:hypothetical protein [Paraburkholderia polaris]NMM03177.1 hypothetical protein [Paraburkholderia polaris]
MKTSHVSSVELAAKICSDPSASYWLKEAIKALLKRDPVDAVNDSEVLAEIMRARLSEIEFFGGVGNLDVRPNEE